jgi:SsrA-binding protein
MASEKKPTDRFPVCRSHRARFEFEILETIEAGMVLVGTEVKALRAKTASLEEAFAMIRNDEVFLHKMNIAEYKHGNLMNHDPVRVRKLLLHREQIRKLKSRVEEKGITLIPLEVYFKDGRAKVALALAKGKKLHDKREATRTREAKKEIAREIRRYRRD